MRLVITLGDPAGIGPEVTEHALRTYLQEDLHSCVVLCGPHDIAHDIVRRLHAQGADARRIAVQAQQDFIGPRGEPSAASGACALAALQAGMHLVGRPGLRQALVTAPISKHALRMAGSAEVGHTDLLGRVLGRGPIAMAFFTSRLQVALCTVHLPLRDIFAALSSARILDVATLLDGALRARLAPKVPRLAVAGLNPHAGEHGLFGDEEARLIEPAVRQAKAQGLDLQGPFAPDTVFFRAAQDEFDGVVAMYHDQGLIPVKMLSFGEAVNVTLGLSVIRTSPDHGTAFDRVGKGNASPDGMLAALRWAHKLGAEAPERKPL